MFKVWPFLPERKGKVPGATDWMALILVAETGM